MRKKVDLLVGRAPSPAIGLFSLPKWAKNISREKEQKTK
jgi:hypothetical protein